MYKGDGYKIDTSKRKNINKRIGNAAYSLKCKNGLTMFCPDGYIIDKETGQIRRSV